MTLGEACSHSIAQLKLLADARGVCQARAALLQLACLDAAAARYWAKDGGGPMRSLVKKLSQQAGD